MIDGEVAVSGGPVLIPQVRKTSNVIDRARGLLGRSRLRIGEALLIEPCASVHTMGMTYSLDLAFMDDTGLVLKVAENVRPLRCAGARGARSVLEMPAGGLEDAGIERGMRLVWRRPSGAIETNF